MDRSRRQPVGDRNHDATARGIAVTFEMLYGGWIEPSSEIGTGEIKPATGSAASDLDRHKPELGYACRQRGGIEGGMHGVAGARMIEREI